MSKKRNSLSPEPISLSVLPLTVMLKGFSDRPSSAACPKLQKTAMTQETPSAAKYLNKKCLVFNLFSLLAIYSALDRKNRLTQKTK
jgi:hypothetical protein